MARNTSPQRPNLQAETQAGQWDRADWDHARVHDDSGGDEHDEVAGHHARRLLSRSNSRRDAFIDRLLALPRWLVRERWVRRLVVSIVTVAAVFAVSFAALWWRLGTGPINLDIATPWLAAAIEDNIGHGNTVEVGGTQIERAGRIHVAVRLRDVVVRDQDHAVVASAPKAEVRLSGAELLMGRLRAESLKLVDAELAVRITSDGTVTVSTGASNKPLATGVASKRDAGLPATFPRADGGAAAPGMAAPQGVSQPGPVPPSAVPAPSGVLAGLDWLDSLSLSGLDGQNLNEIGLKNGVLVVDDQQRGNKWTFENISLSLRRPMGGAWRSVSARRAPSPGRCASPSARLRTACARWTSRPTRSRPATSCWRCG